MYFSINREYDIDVEALMNNHRKLEWIYYLV